MDDLTPEEQEQLAQWEAEQADRVLERTAQLETELIIADQRLQALRAFMAEARSYDGDLEDWLMDQQQKGDSPGAHRGLHVMQDGSVRFLDLQD